MKEPCIYDLIKYVDALGKTKYVYAWKLLPTDRTPKGKRDDLSLREKERIIQRDLYDGIDTQGGKMTLCQLYAKKNAQRPNVTKNTEVGRKYLMKALEDDILGSRSIDTIKPSDAREWATRMQQKGFSFDFLLSVIFCFCYLVFLMLTSFRLLSKYERALYIRLNQIITRTRLFCIKFVLVYL